MDYVTPTDPLLAFALYSGMVVFVMTILLLLVIAILRISIDRRQRKEQALNEYWQQVFIHAIEGVPLKPARITGRDRETILMVWIHFTESIRGDARLRLRQLALDIKLDRTARKLLARGNVRAKLLGIVGLGRLSGHAAWDDLAKLVADPNPMLSLLATRSLVQLDAQRAVPLMLFELVRRDDWPLGKVADTLREVPADILGPLLLETLRSVTAANAARLLKLIDIAQIGDTWPALGPLLEATQPAEVLAAALKACSDPRGLASVRALTEHEQWVVRAQAVATLGQLGSTEDVLLIEKLLSDPEWWVRYHAGKALIGLPFMSRGKLEAMQAKLTDKFAADILSQLLAEDQLQATA